MINLGISNLQKMQLPEGCLDLVSDRSRSEVSSNSSGSDFIGVAANFSTACWSVFLEDVTLTSAGLSTAMMV